MALQKVKPCGPIPAPGSPPMRRIESIQLPDYRFVPGVNPHPFRHPDGHMYTDGSSPKEEHWDEGMDWRKDPRFLYAADLFDHRYYWEAHEQWEALWHFASPDGDTKAVLQSLIQIAAAMLQHHMGSSRGASSLLGRASERLMPILDGDQPVFRGIDLAALIAESRACLAGGEWPILSVGGP